MGRRTRGLLVVAAMLPALARGEVFLSCLEDLPLMPGLAEESCFLFDTVNGRVAGGEASGRGTRDGLRAFYHDVLPSLGWAMLEGDALVAEREGEELRVALTEEPDRIRVRYTLVPSRHPASPDR